MHEGKGFITKDRQVALKLNQAREFEKETYVSALDLLCGSFPPAPPPHIDTQGPRYEVRDTSRTGGRWRFWANGSKTSDDALGGAFRRAS